MTDNVSFKQWVLSHLLLAGLLVLVLIPFFEMVNRDLKLAFLDVGQGDAILIQTPEFKNILIDAGPDSRIVDRLGEEMGFFEKKIDLFIMTHPDRDHYAGILDVLRQYEIQSIMLTGIANSDFLYEEFLDLAKKKEVQFVFPKSIQDVQIGKRLFLDILYPFESQSLIGQKVKDKNNTSIVLRLVEQREGKLKSLALLNGDAGVEQEYEIMLSGQNVTSEVLKLGHHGSKTSSLKAFLEAVDPKMAVVSAGEDNQFGHPHPEVIEKVDNILVQNTAKEGTIRFLW